MSTETIKFHCTVCGVPHSIPVEQAGAPFHCESCRNIFLAPLKSEEPLPVNRPVVIQPSAELQTSRPPIGGESVETYAVAAEYVAEGAAATLEPAGSWPDPADLTPPVPLKTQRYRPIPSIVDQDLDPNADPEYQLADEFIALFQGTGRWIMVGLLLLVAGNFQAAFKPEYRPYLSGAFYLVLVAMVVAAWVLLVRHAARNDPDSSTTLLWPPNLARYALESWPESRQSVQLLALAAGWLVAAWIVAVPFDLVSSFFAAGQPAVAENGKPPGANPPQVMPAMQPAQQPAAGQPVAANPQAGALPAMPAMPAMQPPQAMPAVVASAETAIRSVSRQLTADGGITTTVILNDGSVQTKVQQTQSKLKPTEEELRRHLELSQRVNATENKVGDVIQVQLTGTDSELVWGGRNGVYARGSSPSSAAVHAGVVKVDETAKVKVTILAAEGEYPAVDQNGVSSLGQAAGAKFGFKIERAD